MIPLPICIVIKSIPVKIIYCDKMSEVDEHGNEKLWGRADYRNSVIRVYRGKRPDEAVWQTLWHEIMHFLFLCHGRDITDEIEEQLIDYVSIGMNGVMIDNGFTMVGGKK